MAPGLLLSDLAPDVIFAIFVYCDIYSVVSTAQTCRYLHQLAFDKSVWLVLLDNLRRRSILDRTRTPTIETLSVDEMKRGVLWIPAPWRRFSAETRLHPTIRNGPGVTYWENVAKLLPSGRHVLFNNRNKLECWNVADDKLMWKHVSGVAEAVVLEFAAEETHFGSSANIIICARTYPLGGRRKNYVEIVTLDLQTGGSNTVLVTRAPSARDDNSYCNPAICGGLAAVGVTSTDRFMILNWREIRILFSSVGRSELPSQLVLIQRHVLIKTSSQIDVITNIRLDPYWKPTLDISAPLEFSVVPAINLPTFIPSETIPIASGYAAQRTRRISRGSSATSSRSPSMERPIGVVETQSFVVSSPYRVIPYSGHTLLQTKSETPPRVYTMCPPTSSAPARVEVPFCGEYQDVAPYSGAITYCTRSSIVIKYYE
ncbi:hypothetical protein B0H14DRAFT_3443520 [Mycena olivaceomarginata]|nr:hypothetical protein B0H14DRAFT_3443520 [Mycena olivaceomarginata]